MRETAAVALASGVSLWWLTLPGALPEQTVRAGALLATTAFVVATVATRTSFTHRALFAVAAAAGAVLTWCVLFGRSWAELHWWVQFRTGAAARQLAERMKQAAAGNSGARPALAEQFQSWLEGSTRFVADSYPAIVALEILVGLALATAVYHRIARAPVGAPLGRLREFRFSEHLGWAAALPLVILMVPKLAAAKVAAINLLVLAGALYALRGVAVVSFGLWLLGGGGVFTTAMLAFAVVFMMPVLLAGVLLLGVVDAGVDLRRRWLTPPARG